MQKLNGKTHHSRVIKKAACPLCVAQGRDTAGDNLAVYDDGHEYCYAEHGLIKGDAKDFILEDKFTYEHLPWRGVSKETMKFYDVKTKIDAEGKPIALGFKYPHDTLVRPFNPAKGELKAKWSKTTKGAQDGDASGRSGLEGTGGGYLFGSDRFDPGAHKYITVTEGALDALSIYDALGYASVSVRSASSAGTDCASGRSFLNSFERIYIAFDNDESGRQAVHQVARLFDPNKVYVVRFVTHKDANEYIQADQRVELKRVWWAAKPYLPDKVISGLDDFNKILAEPAKKGVPYPFEILNTMTDGIRTGETVLITAQEKVGKTELMHFIEHQLLTRTTDNVAAFFLEEPPKRHLEALAGIQLKYPLHLPGKERPREEVSAALGEVIKGDDRLFVYSHFGNDDGDNFLDTIRFLATARRCRYILFDHISMVVSGILGSAKGSEREYIDYLATKLEMMVKELDIALIMVSHVNDFGQTRGSRWLTKVCDLQINATRDMMSSNPVERNTIRLSVPISRYPGLTGDAGGIIFDRETYSFTEVPANDNVQPHESMEAA